MSDKHFEDAVKAKKAFEKELKVYEDYIGHPAIEKIMDAHKEAIRAAEWSTYVSSHEGRRN